MNALDYTDTVKPVMLSESGFLPEPENAARDGIYWLGCVLWGEDYLIKGAGLRRGIPIISYQAASLKIFITMIR